MKTIIASLIMAALTLTQVSAQPAHTSTPDKSKMKVFDSWVGHWQGEGFTQQGPSISKKSFVDEKIEMKLGGVVLAVEGVGKTDAGTDQEKVVHHAFGVLHYDQNAGAYKFKSFLMDGRTTDAWFEVVAENKFKWGFDVPNGKITYSITLDAASGKWNEIGEYSADGTVWRKFFEMNLSKVQQ
jgi:hypothetical protein